MPMAFPTSSTVVASVGNSDPPAWIHALHRYATETFSELVTTNGLRLIAIIGGYLLLRPHLFRLVNRQQASQLHQHSQGAPVPNVSEYGSTQESESECTGESMVGDVVCAKDMATRLRKASKPKSGRMVIRVNAGRGC